MAINAILASGLFGGLVGAVVTQIVTEWRDRRANSERKKAISREAAADFIAAVGDLLGCLSMIDAALDHEDFDEFDKRCDAGTDIVHRVNVACARAQLAITDAAVEKRIEAVYARSTELTTWFRADESNPTNPIDQIQTRLREFYERLDSDLADLIDECHEQLRPE